MLQPLCWATSIISTSCLSTLLWHHVYLLLLSAMEHPEMTCASVPGLSHNEHFPSLDSSHCTRFALDGSWSYVACMACASHLSDVCHIFDQVKCHNVAASHMVQAPYSGCWTATAICFSSSRLHICSDISSFLWWLLAFDHHGFPNMTVTYRSAHFMQFQVRGFGKSLYRGGFTKPSGFQKLPKQSSSYKEGLCKAPRQSPYTEGFLEVPMQQVHKAPKQNPYTERTFWSIQGRGFVMVLQQHWCRLKYCPLLSAYYNCTSGMHIYRSVLWYTNLYTSLVHLSWD